MPSLENRKLVRLATYAAVSVAGLLTIVKLFAWWLTGSVSLLASFIDSLLDGVASVVLLFAVRQSQQRATRSFRFGYGKVEALAVLGQSIFIFVSIIWLLYEALERLLNPTPLDILGVGIGCMVFTMGVTSLLLAFQKYVIKRTQSVAVRADSMHYSMDFLINGGVLVSLLVTRFTGWHWVDSAVAITLGVSILFSLRKMIAESVGILMDRELDEPFRTALKDIACAHPAVHGVHDLRTRASGDRKFVQMHLELDGELSLSAAHRIAEEVEKDMVAKFPDCEVIIHQDPMGVTERRDKFAE